MSIDRISTDSSDLISHLDTIDKNLLERKSSIPASKGRWNTLTSQKKSKIRFLTVTAIALICIAATGVGLLAGGIIPLTIAAVATTGVLALVSLSLGIVALSILLKNKKKTSSTPHSPASISPVPLKSSLSSLPPSSLESPSLRSGINNIINSCYINTAFQTFAHIPMFRDTFDSEKNPLLDKEAVELQAIGHTIINQILDGKSPSSIARNMIEFREKMFQYKILEKKAGDTRGTGQYDSSELIINLLSKLNVVLPSITCTERISFTGFSPSPATDSRGNQHSCMAEDSNNILTKKQKEQEEKSKTAEFIFKGEYIENISVIQEALGNGPLISLDTLINEFINKEELHDVEYRSEQAVMEGMAYLMFKSNATQKKEDLIYPDLITVSFQELNKQQVQMPINWTPPGSNDVYELQTVIYKRGGKDGGHYYALLRENEEQFIEANDSSIIPRSISSISDQLNSGYMYYYTKKTSSNPPALT